MPGLRKESKMDAVQEEGVVMEIHEGKATVRIDKSSSCAHCKAGCMERSGAMVTEANNLAGARVGDTVRLELNAKAALNASLAVFGIPLLALLLGVVLGSVIADQAGYQEQRQFLSIGVGAVLFFLSFTLVRAYDRRIEKSESHRTLVVEILKRAG